MFSLSGLPALSRLREQNLHRVRHPNRRERGGICLRAVVQPQPSTVQYQYSLLWETLLHTQHLLNVQQIATAEAQAQAAAALRLLDATECQLQQEITQVRDLQVQSAAATASHAADIARAASSSRGLSA